VIKDSKFTKNLSPSYFSPACGMNSSANTSDHEGDPNWATVNYGDLEALGNLHPSTSATPIFLRASVVPTFVHPGWAGPQLDLRSSFDDQSHREFYESMQQDHYMVKREDENQHYTGVSMNGGRTQQNVCHYPELLVVVFMYSRLLISGQNQSHMSLFMSIHLVLADESGLLKQSPTRTTFCLLCHTHWCNLCR